MANELVTIQIVSRREQELFLRFIAEHMGVSLSAVGRWAFDDARASLLSRSCLEEKDLPEAIRKHTDATA